MRPHEVLRPHRNVRNGVANKLPPKTLWSHMAPTLRVDDKIRTRLGSQLNYINSAYRSPAYNAKCPGAASRSYHMQNCALDLMFGCGSETAFAMAKTLRSEGVFRGGIGYSSFIHIDTRGHDSTWGQA
ncbi:MAG: YcbK family protein [Verrucomicrobiales bacterium]